MGTEVITYAPPPDAPRSYDYQVTLNGQPVFVYYCRIAAYATWSAELGPVEVAVTFRIPSDRAVIKPFSRGLTPAWDGATMRFTVASPGHLSIETPDMMPLHLFGNPLETHVPDPADPNVIYFAAGKTYSPGKITLQSGQTLYVEGGAVVRTVIEATEARHIRVAGRGILDATTLRGPHGRFCMLKGCTDVDLGGLILVGTPSWTIHLQKCRRVHVDNIKAMGWWVGSDGVDVCACHDVLIENCFLRDNDDCVAIKVLDYQTQTRDEWLQSPPSVENVVVRNCVLHNDHAGNAMEIGFELRGDHVRNVVFRDCDVIAKHGEGGVFTIHNGEWATVENILYENIRVDHFYMKLVDFLVITSRYTRGAERGRIRNVTLRDITTIKDICNTLSIIGGYDRDHLVENVVFDNFVMGGVKVMNEDQLNLYWKHARGIEFR